jgi:hypothetical protein
MALDYTIVRACSSSKGVRYDRLGEHNMSMFDWYKPATELRCPMCGNLLIEWQGKDGPCALFLWQEGVKYPVDQLADAEEVRLSREERVRFTLPVQFTIYSYDCPDHHPIDAQCGTYEEVWSSTVINPK